MIYQNTRLCFIHQIRHDYEEKSVSADGLRKAFNIPENETIMAVISLGYRAAEPDRPDRRPLTEIVKFY